MLDLATTAETPDDAFGWLFRATGQRLTTAERLRATLAARSKTRWRIQLTAVPERYGPTESGPTSSSATSGLSSGPTGCPAPSARPASSATAVSAYLDNLYQDQLACVELDGRAAHPVGERWRDYRRDNAGATDGIITLRYGWSDVTGGPCQVARQVAAVLTQRGWSGPARRCGSGCALPRDRGP